MNINAVLPPCHVCRTRYIHAYDIQLNRGAVLSSTLAGLLAFTVCIFFPDSCNLLFGETTASRKLESSCVGEVGLNWN